MVDQTKHESPTNDLFSHRTQGSNTHPQLVIKTRNDSIACSFFFLPFVHHCCCWWWCYSSRMGNTTNIMLDLPYFLSSIYNFSCSMATLTLFCKQLLKNTQGLLFLKRVPFASVQLCHRSILLLRSIYCVKNNMVSLS